MDECELIKRAKSGDKDAFKLIIESNYDFIYRVAFKFILNRENAEDIAQQVCVELGEKILKFKGESKLSTWLYQITLNKCRDVLRRARTHGELNIKYLELQELKQKSAEDKSVLLKDLYQELRKLDDALYETALLILSEEKSHAEAGIILGCAESTISWRMSEIKKGLKRFFQEKL